jgi:antitoxin component YwqK of YwqJK toxin-antitoxin module
MTMICDDAVLAVLKRLEADNRMMKRVGGSVLAVLLVLMCAAAFAPQGQGNQQGKPDPKAIQDIVRTRRLELADARGAVVAVLHAAEEQQEPGWLVDFHDNGRRKWRAQVANNRYEGQFTAWWPNGLKAEEGTYVKGRRHGLFTSYHENGQPKSTGTWSDGIRAGIWTFWHDNGQKQSEGLYEDDRKIDVWKEWHQNGKPAATCPYKNGEKEGHCESWHDNGERNEELDWRGGVKTGAFRSWFANGQPRAEGSFDAAGRPTGEWKYWLRDGSADVKNSGTYEQGKRVK